MTMTTTNIDVL